jgi:hypothetical protein
MEIEGEGWELPDQSCFSSVDPIVYGIIVDVVDDRVHVEPRAVAGDVYGFDLTRKRKLKADEFINAASWR